MSNFKRIGYLIVRILLLIKMACTDFKFTIYTILIIFGLELVDMIFEGEEK